MHICIDSCVFIRGLRTQDPVIAAILDRIGPAILLSIPRLVVQELTRNLSTTGQIRNFYRLFSLYDFARIVDEPVPIRFVEKYTDLGLPAKADAFIGGFAEWQGLDFLLSDNRHFLRQLQSSAFEVVTPDDFLPKIQMVN
jgi:hypothetical protein